MSKPRASLSSLREFAENLPFLHPQPTPRASREWSLDTTRRTSIGLPTPSSSKDGSKKFKYGLGFSRGHRRQLSLSTFSVRGLVCLGALVGIVIFLGLGISSGLGFSGWGNRSPVPGGDGVVIDDGGPIPFGQSRERGGREVFWWEGFDRLLGLYKGWRETVPFQDWVSEQDGGLNRGEEIKSTNSNGRRETRLVDVTTDQGFAQCYVDEDSGILPPKLRAYDGVPQGFPAPLFGSHKELDLRNDVCYDRFNRFGPYGFGFPEEEGGLGDETDGDIEGKDAVHTIDYRGVQWGKAQDACLASKRYKGPRSAFIIRTWQDFDYTPYHIMMLRSIISELTLTSGGKYTVHFLIHVQNDSIPIWASDKIYDQVLNSSLPAEFAGMGSLWSVAQMKLIYPPPFPESVVNFSGDEIYKAYRSLHFPLQYFAQQHPEFEYFWHWEMDMRVTGGYLELLEQITTWAERQQRIHLWEQSSKLFVPGLFENSYSAYKEAVKVEVMRNAASGKKPISGPQLPAPDRLNVAGVTDVEVDEEYTDLITFSPLFDPIRTKWAFHDDITGYPRDLRPPTRAALITASRLSRRLLLTMHHETFERKHTMFPEMFPASIALHYGYKAVYAPLPIYLDRNWPSVHANEVFNNAPIGEEGRKAGMDHGSGFFHGEGGSVFGPGEHVFRGATWYANAHFAGYLWRRWLGKENPNGELAWEKGPGGGRMCLPMMVFHPVKFEFYT